MVTSEGLLDLLKYGEHLMLEWFDNNKASFNSHKYCYASRRLCCTESFN